TWSDELFAYDVSVLSVLFFFFFSSRRRHTRSKRDWSSDVCSSDLDVGRGGHGRGGLRRGDRGRHDRDPLGGCGQGPGEEAGEARGRRRGRGSRPVGEAERGEGREAERVEIGRASWRGRGADGAGGG